MTQMKRLFTILLLCFYIFNVNAQDDLSVESLSKRSKITQKEKKDATVIINCGSSGKSTDWWEVDDDTWGVAYSYSPHFPLALSANGTWSYFKLEGELGFTLSGKEYDWKENVTAKPVGYVMASPGFYCKYFSVQCGVGALVDIRKEIKESTGTNITQTTTITIGTSTSISSHADETIYQNGYYETKKPGFNLCFKPSLTGYIPIDDDYYLTVNAGYIFVPKLKDLNGFTVGVGFQVEF